MVAWSLPHSQESFLLIDTRPDLEEQERELEDIHSGFLVNRFLSSHPSRSILLKADILITSTHEGHQTQVDPTLSGEQIDQFLNALEENGQRDLVIPQDHTSQEVAAYTDLVKSALEEIEAGNAQKIVLARYEDHQIETAPDCFQKFEELNRRYPNAMTYACYLPGKGVWLGATPEELIELKENRFFRTVALAGTQSLPEDAKLGDITWTQKEIEEQALVSRYIIDCFKKIRLREFEEYGPKTVKAGQLAHLKTQFTVDMQETNSPRLGTTMLDLLHPTSAVCGMPLGPSLEFIKTYEGFDRELYAGFLGPVQIQGHTNLFVNLRCAKIQGNQVRLYAGAGITEDSDPDKELIETELKLNTMKHVVLKP